MSAEEIGAPEPTPEEYLVKLADSIKRRAIKLLRVSHDLQREKKITPKIGGTLDQVECQLHWINRAQLRVSMGDMGTALEYWDPDYMDEDY